jgi:hypothetical protein
MDFYQILAQLQETSGASYPIHELDESSDICDQPENIKVALKRHQLSLLKRCMDYENESIDVVPNVCKLSTRIGIIADKTGSGKSNVILSLLFNNLVSRNDQINIKSFGMNKAILHIKDPLKPIKTSVLAIPHNLVNQWNDYVGLYSDNFKFITVCNKKTYEKLESSSLQEFDLVIVTCKFLSKLTLKLRELDVKVSRVIYDEVDSMNLSSIDIKSSFTWFVTASFSNLLYPKGYGKWDRINQRYISVAEGLPCTGYIKNLFHNLLVESQSNISMASLLIVKNKDAYVDKSFMLPDVLQNFIRCKTPRSINILTGIVDRNIIECLNSDDVNGAIEYINPSQKNTEENIISILLNKYTRNIHNVDTMLDYVTNRLVYDNENQRVAEINRLNKSKSEYVSKIESITNRIKETNTCCICYEDITQKTILRCCSNAFCFKCITLWVNQSHVCPLCKSHIDTDSMMIVSKEACTPVIEEQAPDASQPNSAFDKMQNLQIILNKMTNTDKVLIFSSNDEILHNVQDIMKSNNTRFAMLKGNHMVINHVIKDYKDGDLNILLANPRNYGSGLNLENTTDIIMLHKFDNDIENQVIGRAQRFGRQSSLRVWYLLYDSEMPTPV